MSEIAERVERHMADTSLPQMKIRKAPEAEGLQGGEDILSPKPKESGTVKFSDMIVQPEAQEETPVVTPEPPPETNEPVEGQKTEEVSDAVDSFMDRLGFNKPKTKKAEVEPEPEPEQQEEPEPEPEVEQQEELRAEEEPVKAKRKRKKKEGIDAEDIKDIIRTTAESVAQSSTSPQEPIVEKKAVNEIELKNKKDLEVFSEMEKDSKYKGIRNKHLDYLTKLSQYKTEWLKDNPSGKFSLDDIEHEDFISGNQPSYDINDFTDARITVKARSLIQEQERSYRDQIEELRSSVDEGNMKEELQAASNSSVAEIVKIADESYLKVVQDGGGDALKDSDPVAHDVLNEVLSSNEKALYELEKLTHPSKKFRLNINNETHKKLIDFAIQKEKDISNLPLNDQMHQGKRFATTQQWQSMNETQRLSYWRIQPEHIKAMYISDVGQDAKNRIDKQREVFDKYVQHKSGQKSSPKKNEQPKPAQQKRVKTNPPSTAGEAVTATGGNPAATVDLGDGKNMSKRLWG